MSNHASPVAHPGPGEPPSRGVPRRTRRLVAFVGRGLTPALLLMALSTCTHTNIEPVAVGEIRIVPPRVEALVHDRTALSAEMRDQDGNPVTGRSVRWASLDETVAEVDAEGFVTATGPGETLITATVDGLVGVAQVVAERGPEVRTAVGAVALTGAAGSARAATTTVAVTNGGTGTLDGLTAAAESKGGSESWLTATLTRSRAPADLRISAQASGLPKGTYKGTVTVSGPRNTAEVDVEFQVVDVLALVAVSPGALEIRSRVGGKLPDKREIRVTNDGNGEVTGLDAEIDYEGRTGWLTASLSRASTPATLTLRVTTSAMTPGDYAAQVRVRGGGSQAAVAVVYKVRLPD